MAEYRVLVAADDLLARRGLATLLAEMAYCEVLGPVAAGAFLPDAIDRYDPDALLYDLGWSSADAVAHVSALRDYGVPVVALIPDDSAARVVNAALMSTGAHGLLLRDSTPEVLASAIDGAINGLVVIDPALLGAIVHPTPPTAATPVETLTPRESEVLQLLARGLTNKAIAHRLNITEHTVKFHVNAILGKLNAQSRTEAVVHATRLGLIVL